VEFKEFNDEGKKYVDIDVDGNGCASIRGSIRYKCNSYRYRISRFGSGR
jgi:hypothetical protein